MSASTDLCLPLEILYEFVLQDQSSASLAAWCLVSRALLHFAGPLIYVDTVSIRRAKHVVPFLTRLLFPPSPRQGPLLLPCRRIKRLDIHGMPTLADLEALQLRFNRLPAVQDLVVGLHFLAPRRFGSPVDARARLVALDRLPILLSLLRPTRYEEITYNMTTQAPYLSGHVLAVYISSGLLLGPDDTIESHHLYQTCLQAIATLDLTRSGISHRTTELDDIHQQVGGGVGLLMPADLAKAYAIASALESGDTRLLTCATAGELGHLTQVLQMGALAYKDILKLLQKILVLPLPVDLVPPPRRRLLSDVPSVPGSPHVDDEALPDPKPRRRYYNVRREEEAEERYN